MVQVAKTFCWNSTNICAIQYKNFDVYKNIQCLLYCSLLPVAFCMFLVAVLLFVSCLWLVDYCSIPCCLLQSPCDLLLVAVFLCYLLHFSLQLLGFVAVVCLWFVTVLLLIC